MNFNIRIDLMKLKNVTVEEMMVGGKPCHRVCIPVEDNAGPVKFDGQSCFLSLAAFELPTPKDHQSHLIKPLLPKTQVFGMSYNAVRAIPYLGNMRPWDSPSPPHICKLCNFAVGAKYTSGGYYTRCTHPKANKNTACDVRYIDECPKDNDRQTK